MMHLKGRNFEAFLAPCHHSNSKLASPSQPGDFQKKKKKKKGKEINHKKN